MAYCYDIFTNSFLPQYTCQAKMLFIISFMVPLLIEKCQISGFDAPRFFYQMFYTIFFYHKFNIGFYLTFCTVFL